jgi:hypothetical protein
MRGAGPFGANQGTDRCRILHEYGRRSSHEAKSELPGCYIVPKTQLHLFRSIAGAKSF